MTGKEERQAKKAYTLALAVVDQCEAALHEAKETRNRAAIAYARILCPYKVGDILAPCTGTFRRGVVTGAVLQWGNTVMPVVLGIKKDGKLSHVEVASYSMEKVKVVDKWDGPLPKQKDS